MIQLDAQVALDGRVRQFIHGNWRGGGVHGCRYWWAGQCGKRRSSLLVV